MRADGSCTRWPRSAVVLTLAALHAIAAQAAEPAIPSAGTVLQQVSPAASPGAPASDTGLSIERHTTGILPAGVAVRIARIDIAGNDVIDSATLHDLVADAEGTELNLAQMGALAVRITDYYHARGYPLARALVPAQNLQAGVLRIDVNEARYGQISVENGSRVSDRLVRATLAGLKSGAVVAQEEMDRALLLLADMPGVVVNATLKAGEQPGTSDLQVVTSPAPMLSGGATLDNHGDRYTGRVRAGAALNTVDLLGLGDALNLSLLTAGRGMQYGRAGYDALLNGAGLRAGVSYSALRYRLLGSLSDLDVTGSAGVATAWARQTFIRSLGMNLYGQIDYSRVRLSDQIRSVSLHNDRHLDNLGVSLSGNAVDGLAGGGESRWSAGLTRGRVGFDDTDAQASDAQGARTAGNFTKATLNLVRLQNLGTRDMLLLNLTGQWASHNLDASQKLAAGGVNSVRAYDTGALSGDAGYTLTAELRHALALEGWESWQATAFVDGAHVEVNRNPIAADARSANLWGAGTGLNWNGPERLLVRLALAAPVGARPRQIGNAGGVRVWVQASKGF